MTNRRSVLNRKQVPNHSSPQDAGPVVSVDRTRVGKGSAGRCRFRYDTRVDDPQGWRSHFMSF